MIKDMIQDLKDKLEREKSKNKVLLQILEDTQKCITNGKKFLEENPVIIAKVYDPYKRQEQHE
jgi:hypothetical protein